MLGFFFTGEIPDCYACGDPALRKFRGRPVCYDCFAELAHGEIRNQNVHFLGGGRGSADGDDASPWQENAIRHMEG